MASAYRPASHPGDRAPTCKPTSSTHRLGFSTRHSPRKRHQARVRTRFVLGALRTRGCGKSIGNRSLRSGRELAIRDPLSRTASLPLAVSRRRVVRPTFPFDEHYFPLSLLRVTMPQPRSAAPTMPTNGMIPRTTYENGKASRVARCMPNANRMPPTISRTRAHPHPPKPQPLAIFAFFICPSEPGAPAADGPPGGKGPGAGP